MNNATNSALEQLAAPPKTWRPRSATVKVVTIASLAMMAGFAFRTSSEDTALSVDEPAPYITAQTAIPQEDTTHIVTVNPEPILLDGVADLNLSAQSNIWSLCKEDPRLFATVMAIANRETRFDMYAIGDGGESIGLMQINAYWQSDRIERLGITDLTDYRQNVKVAVDYIDWIAERINPEHPEDAYGTHELFMAYNQGWAGANRSWSAGCFDTAYSRECFGYFEVYMNALEVEP